MATARLNILALARQGRRLRAPLLVAVVGALISVVAVTSAQQQVNTQLYGNSGPSVKYGWGPGYATPPTVQHMPSESWHAYYQSGATPSEVAMNRARYGPLAPAGFVTYLPEPGPGYKVGSVGTLGNYVPTALAPVPMHTMSGLPAMPGVGSVRYGAPSTAVPGFAAPRPTVGVGAAPMGVAMPAGARISGSVRYR